MKKRFRQYIGFLVDLFYPRLCPVCGRALQHHEPHLCLHCLQNIPRTQLHLHGSDNEMEQLFRGKVPVEKAAAFFYFTHSGDYRHLIHHIKYRGEKECARYLGALYAREIGSRFFADIDLLVPVPLHPRRLRKRGYNQSEYIAAGIADATGVPVAPEVLQRIRQTQSQTAKGIYQRWKNTRDSFRLQSQPENIEGKHLLLIDDVVTTGATLLACIEALHDIKNIKISLLTLSMAR